MLDKKDTISKEDFEQGSDKNYYYIYFYKAPYGMCNPCGDDNDMIFLKYQNEIYRFGWIPKWYGDKRMILSSGWTNNKRQKLKDMLEKEFGVLKNGFYHSSEIYCKINCDYIDLSEYVKPDSCDGIPRF